MPQQTIKFTISQDGTVSEEVIGVIGNGCMELTEPIEKALGTSVYIEPKLEYYKQENVTFQHDKNENKEQI